MESTSIRADFSDNPWVKGKRSQMKSYMIMEGVEESYGDSISYIQIYPAGSATGTLEDFTRFGQGLISDENLLFDKSETRDKFLSPSRYYEKTDIPRIYHGLWTLPYGSGIVGHSGNTQGYTSSLYFDLESSRLVCVMTNELGETAFNYGILGLIFGDLNLDLGKISEEKDISGIYTSARANIPKGYGSIYSYMGGLLPLKKAEEPRTFDLAIGQGTVRQVSDSIFLLDNDNGLKILKNLKEAEGRLVFESFTGDEFKENTFSFIIKIGLFLAFLLGGIITLVWLIIDLIRLLVSRRKNKSLELSRNSILIKFLNIGLVILVLVLILSDGFTRLGQARPIVFGIIILSLSLVFLGRKTIKDESKSQLLLLVFISISIINVLYWQWFNFWT